MRCCRSSNPLLLPLAGVAALVLTAPYRAAPEPRPAAPQERDVAAETAEGVPGRYAAPDSDAAAEVSLEGERYFILTAEGRCELRPAAQPDRWTFGHDPVVTLRVNRNDDGEVVSLTRIAGGEVRELRRIGTGD